MILCHCVWHTQRMSRIFSKHEEKIATKANFSNALLYLQQFRNTFILLLPFTVPRKIK